MHACVCVRERVCVCARVCVSACPPTVEGQVPEQRGQEVHDQHGGDGHVGDHLHLLPAAAAEHITTFTSGDARGTRHTGAP